MKHGLLMIALFIAATALTSGQYSSTLQGGSSSKPDPTTATPAPTTTTPAPTTTTPAPTTTTPAPTTTTAPPNTTTHAPNTTTHAPNTTTHAPNTTTTIAPKTTTAIPAPTPSANLTVGKYNVTENGKLCILAEFAIGIRVTSSEVNGTFIVQQSKTNSSGECLDKSATLSMLFVEGGINMKFKYNDTAQKIYVEFVNVDLTYAFKTGVSRDYSGTNRSLELFASAPGHYYSCSSQTVYMGNGLSLDLTHNKIQAFNFKNNEFGIPDVCKADQPDYRVPIAVGIILIILIVIVVIAYLISRKRRTDGYQSL